MEKSHNRVPPQQFACDWIRSKKFLTIGYQDTNRVQTLKGALKNGQKWSKLGIVWCLPPPLSVEETYAKLQQFEFRGVSTEHNEKLFVWLQAVASCFLMEVPEESLQLSMGMSGDFKEVPVTWWESAPVTPMAGWCCPNISNVCWSSWLMRSGHREILMKNQLINLWVFPWFS